MPRSFFTTDWIELFSNINRLTYEVSDTIKWTKGCHMTKTAEDIL